MKIEPRKESDKGGWLCMPLVTNVPFGRDGWRKVRCPICGALCWERPSDEDVIEQRRLEGACCTFCAFKKGQNRHEEE